MDQKYDKLVVAINEGEVEDGIAAANELVAAGTSPIAIFSECIQDTLNDLGEQFARLEVFLPELIMASDVVKGIQEELMPLLLASGDQVSCGRAVIGTAYGDVHDIGKNMVSLMMQVNGFDVKDLGVSVPAQSFIEAALEHKADLICMSGLMLPSLPYMQDVIDLVKGNDKYKDRFRIMVGGGPVTQEWADRVGADGYSDDALSAVDLARQLMATFA